MGARASFPELGGLVKVRERRTPADRFQVIEPPSRAHRRVVKTYRMDAGRIRATCSHAIDPETARAWIASSAGTLLFRPDGVPRVERSILGGVPVIVKRSARSAAARLASALLGRHGRPKRAFRIGIELLEHGVPAARPLVLLEERTLGLERSAVVLEEAPGETLRELITSKLPSLDPTERDRAKREALGAVASAAARLHEARFRQRDLKAPNIVIASPGSATTATLIDLEGMRILFGAPTWRGRARDLGRLAASLRTAEARAAGIDDNDWMVFIAAYLAACGRGADRARARELLRRTVAWAEKKEERNRRRGRVLH